MSTAISDAGVLFANGDTQAYPVVPVRQTVLSGAVDSNGFSSFGGSTGSTTVTTSTTLIATAANGVTNRTGSIVNPSWTSLSTNGTMYVFMDTNADGTCTTGSGTLAPIYQWGGTPSVTSGQFTFNIQEMKGYVGNGSTAVQTYRVYVGEVTVAGGVVTAIVWYALMGRYDSGFTATLPAVNTLTSKNHNIGIKPDITSFIFECTTADVGIAVGEQIDYRDTLGADGANFARQRMVKTSTSMAMRTPAGASSFAALNASGVMVTLTAASYKWKMIAGRGW